MRSTDPCDPLPNVTPWSVVFWMMRPSTTTLAASSRMPTFCVGGLASTLLAPLPLVYLLAPHPPSMTGTWPVSFFHVVLALVMSNGSYDPLRRKIVSPGPTLPDETAWLGCRHGLPLDPSPPADPLPLTYQFAISAPPSPTRAA